VVRFYWRQQFVVGEHWHRVQARDQVQRGLPTSKAAQCKFTDDQWVRRYGIRFK
jgi:hypothetical protein